MRRLHGDIGTSIGRTLVLPPLRRGVKLGLLRVGVSTPSARPTGILVTARALPRYGAVGLHVVQLPYAMRMLPARTRELPVGVDAHWYLNQDTVSPATTGPPPATSEAVCGRG